MPSGTTSSACQAQPNALSAANTNSRRASERRSGRSEIAAEAVLSDDARDFIAGVGPRIRTRLLDAIQDIEDDPAWIGPPRHPGQGKHSGRIVDLSVQGYAITYRIADHGAVVLVSAIFPINY